jgi:hypothetical protein
MTERLLRDVYHVRRDGDELKVYNWGNVQIHEQLRPGEVERTNVFVNAGDATFPPDHITQRFADQLADEHGIDATEHGIDVVDLDSDEVSIL